MQWCTLYQVEQSSVYCYRTGLATRCEQAQLLVILIKTSIVSVNQKLSILLVHIVFTIIVYQTTKITKTLGYL